MAEDPAPKGLREDPLSLRFSVHAREGGNGTASGVEKDVFDVDPIPVPEQRSARGGVARRVVVFGIGSRRTKGVPADICP